MCDTEVHKEAAVDSDSEGPSDDETDVSRIGNKVVHQTCDRSFFDHLTVT